MNGRTCLWSLLALMLGAFLSVPTAIAQSGAGAKPEPASAPAKIYVPYEQLKKALEGEKQSVFLPYQEFSRLWAAAQGAPAAVEGAPMPYLISTARFTGKVGAELAALQLELTIDVLQDGWVEVPIALGEVAIAKAEFVSKDADAKAQPLLRVVDGRYVLLTKGAGRRVLKIDFVRQLVTQPGLNILNFRIPSAAISTLELLIPEENMKVDVEPMLAAATSAADVEGKKGTKLQAFLGNADSVKLSWKPKTQAAEELEPVVILDQFQHINVAEALISYDIRFDLDIRRRGLGAFTVQLPADYRVVSVEGANIAKWDIPANPTAGLPQALQVQLFSPVRDKYTLTVKMERFLKDPKVELPLTPALIQQVLRGTGLIAVTHSSARSVEIKSPKNLARVDTGRLPDNIRNQPGATAWRFISSDYGATLDIATVEPRLTATHLWALGVQTDMLLLRGRLTYDIQRSGLFQLSVNLPEPWEVVSVTPADLVDDFQLAGKGPQRMLNILLKREVVGPVTIEISARTPRTAADAPVDFVLPLPDAKGLQQFNGQLVLHLPDQLRAEVLPDAAGKAQMLTPLPINRAADWTSMPGLSKAMAFEFKGIDLAKPAAGQAAPGEKFKIALKPTQISATVHRLVNLEQGAIAQEAVVEYRILYAPVDTLYVKVPTTLVDAGAQITGADIKEKVVVDEAAVPRDQGQSTKIRATTLPTTAGTNPYVAEFEPIVSENTVAVRGASSSAGGVKYTCYKIVLQSPVIGGYTLRVNCRQPWQAPSTQASAASRVQVDPILAAGAISDQNGEIAVAKADTLAVLEPTATGLTAADPSSATDLPYETHRRLAVLAFRYSSPPFSLSLPVLSQSEAAVITTIASAAIVEQVLARDGMLNTHAIYLLSTSRGDRLAITLPQGAKLYGILLNGAEAPVEAGATPAQRIVRLPLTAGAVSKIVLDVSYGLDKASASALTAPALGSDLPVQQTLWRLYVPAEDYVLAHDRTFSLLGEGQGNYLVSTLAAGQPAGVAFKLPAQGRMIEFLRQGAPGTLSVTTMGRELFSILVWVIVLVVGVVLLRVKGFTRVLIVLAAAVLGLIVRLWAPLLVSRMFNVSIWAVMIVLLLWLAQWVFFRLPRWQKRTDPPAPLPLAATSEGAPGSDKATPKE